VGDLIRDTLNGKDTVVALLLRDEGAARVADESLDRVGLRGDETEDLAKSD
jgi:hypothetical protein